MAKKKLVKRVNEKRKVWSKSSRINYKSLRTINFIAAGILGFQAVLTIIFSKTRTLPVTTDFLTKDTISSQVTNQTVLAPATRHVYDLNIAWLAAGILIIAFISHILSATIYRRLYEADLRRRVNRIRWIEYSIAGGLTVSTIALLNGTSDMSTLLAIFGLTATLGLFAMLVELHKEISDRNIVKVAAAIAGLLPWVVIAIYLKSAIIYGYGLPHYVYWIDGTIFVIFLGTVLNMWLHFREKGPWRDYIYYERSYIVLSLIAKTVLTWLVYAGALR